MALLGLVDQAGHLLAEVRGCGHQGLGEQVHESDQHQGADQEDQKRGPTDGQAPASQKTGGRGHEQGQEERDPHHVDDDGAQDPESEDERGIEIDQHDHRDDGNHDRRDGDTAALRVPRQFGPPGVRPSGAMPPSLAARRPRRGGSSGSPRASMRVKMTTPDHAEPGGADEEPTETPPAPPPAEAGAARIFPATSRWPSPALLAFFVGEYVLLPELAQTVREFHQLTQLNFLLAGPGDPARGGRADRLCRAYRCRALPGCTRALPHHLHQHVGPGRQPHAAGGDRPWDGGQLPASDRIGGFGQHGRHRHGRPGHRLRRRAEPDLLAGPARSTSRSRGTTPCTASPPSSA